MRRNFRNTHAVGALDGKHIAMKKPKKSFSEYFNYKGYFSLILLALEDDDYKFLWVNVGASGSSSDVQIFNCSKVKGRNGNRTLVLLPTEPLAPGEPDPHYFLLGDNDFALMPWLVKPYSRRQLTRKGRKANYQIYRGGRECLWNISGKIQGAADHHGAEAKSCERHYVNMCGTT